MLLSRQQSSYGVGYREYVRLRDQFGDKWSGSVERDYNNMARYTVRNATGKSATGVADSFGVILSDHKGKSWRAFQE